MRFNLLPKDLVFYELFETLSRHAVASAEQLRLLAKHFPNIAEPLRRIREEEHNANEVAHAAFDRLDRGAVPPFDRDDVHTLVDGLDDIVDTIDALARRVALYHVEKMEAPLERQAELLVKATTALSEAMHRLPGTKRLSEINDRLIEIHRIENAGDENHDAAVSELFAGETDPLTVIKWKELYDLVEAAIDACEDVSNTLQRIVLKSG